MRFSKQVMILAAALWPFVGSGPASADPYADSVVSFDVGTGGSAGHADSTVALGAPERFTGEGAYPSVVSFANSPFGADEIVSIGSGGHLTVAFDEPIADAPANPFGVDLIVFGNSFFFWDFGNNRMPDSASVFTEPGRIEVSADGNAFFEIPGVFSDGLFPTQGYLDGGVFDSTPGSVLSDFQKPLDPTLEVGDFDGLTLAESRALYDGSGGGTGIDIADAVDGQGQPAGLSTVQYVRITPIGGKTEIDAFVAVPEPGTAALLALGGAAARNRRRRR